MTLSVYLIAGEASGDALGAGLMRSLRAQTNGDVRFAGIGGEQMEAEGLRSLFPYHELSLMGIAEIVPHLLPLMARMNQVVEDMATKQPDVLVTIDSPGFNFRIAQRVIKEQLKCKRVHYVAPTVWAWKPERAKKCAALFDRMLCVLPFEPPYFEEVGLPATFVGHPAVYREPGNGARFREKYQLAPDQPILCMMPGSRQSELKHHMPVFGPVAVHLAQTVPNLALAVPTSRRLLPTLAEWFQGCPFRAVLFSDDADKHDAFAASHAALVKSGTSSLEVAHAGLPQVVAYKTSKFTAAMVRRMIKVRYVSLVNILAAKEVIPELLQEQCQPGLVGEALSTLMRDIDARARQRQEAAAALAMLRVPEGDTPSDAAAHAVLWTVSH